MLLHQLARRVSLQDALEMALEAEAYMCLCLFQPLSPSQRLGLIYGVVGARRRINTLSQRLG